MFLTSRTVLLAARNGHISISRQRASAKFQALPVCFTAKTRREVRLNPSETDLPHLCEAGALSPMCRMCPMCSITRPVPLSLLSLLSLIYRALSTANRKHSTANLPCFNARTQSYKSDQLGARKMLLRSLFPEYADGTLTLHLN